MNATIRLTCLALATPVLLAACAMPGVGSGDFAAQNRPLEERCFVRRDRNAAPAKAPGTTRAEIQAEARDAARRGELDKACDFL